MVQNRGAALSDFDVLLDQMRDIDLKTFSARIKESFDVGINFISHGCSFLIIGIFRLATGNYHRGQETQ